MTSAWKLDRPTCKAVGGETASNRLTKLEGVLAGQSELLSAQSAMLTEQSEAMRKLVSRLSLLEHSSGNPSPVRSCSKVISQPRPVTRVPVVKQPFACSMLGGHT